MSISQWQSNAAAWLGPWRDWVVADEAGQRVALGVALLVLVLALWLSRAVLRRLARQGKSVPALAAVALGGFYAAVWMLRLPPGEWALTAGVAALGVAVVGLLMATLRRGKSRGGKKRAAPAAA